MQENGIVEKASEKSLRIKFERRTACDKCGACAFGNDMYARIDIENTLGAGIGDMVEVRMHDKFVVSSALLVYAIPLAALLLGLVIGYILDQRLSLSFGYLFQIVLSAFGLIAGFSIVIFIDRKMSKKEGFKPELVRIVKTRDELLAEAAAIRAENENNE